MRTTKWAILLGLVLILSSGCSAPTPLPSTNSSSTTSATPNVIVQGVTEGKEILQTIDLDNCNGKSDAVRSEEFTMSVDVTVSAEIAASAGVSAEVVSAEVQAAVGAALSQGSSKSMSIQLTAPPGTHMNFQIAWVGNEQVGVVQDVAGLDIPIAFRSFVPYDVRIRSQFDAGCPGQQPFQEIVPSPASVSSSQSSSDLVNVGDLLYEDTFDNSVGWNIEDGVSIEQGSLIVQPGYDAVPKGISQFGDFVFETRFFIPDSGSMAFYLRHQMPPCPDWNCSIQIALYFSGNYQEIAARRFLGDNLTEQFDIKKTMLVALHPLDWNKMVVEARGSDYSVYINDTFVFRFSDNTYADGSFIIDNSEESNDTIKIDYIRVYQSP